MGVDASSGFERRHELHRQLFYIIIIAGTVVFLYMFHGANRYSTSDANMTPKQKKFRASLISELEIPFSECISNNRTNVYRMGVPNFCATRKQHTSNITLWILLNDRNSREDNVLFTRYFRLRCHMFGTFQNVRISTGTWILQKRIMPGDIAIIPVTLSSLKRKKQDTDNSIIRRMNEIPRELVKLNRWRKHHSRNQVRIGVLHYFDIDANVEMDMKMPKWYRKGDFVISNFQLNRTAKLGTAVQYFPMLPKMPANCVPHSPLVPPPGTTCTCGENREVLLASKRKYAYAVYGQDGIGIRQRIESGNTSAIGRISPNDDLADSMFAIIPCTTDTSRMQQAFYEALTFGAVPLVDGYSNN